MKKLTAVIIATVVVLSLFCLPAQAAADPKLDPVDSAVTKHFTMWGFGFNGGAKIRDRNYAANFDADNAGGKPIVTTKENDDQQALWSAASSNATLGCGFVATVLDAKKDITGAEDTPGSIYCAALQFEIDGGLGDTVCGSFCFVMGPDSSKWGKKLNGFDIWLGTTQEVTLEDYKLAYHADNLVEFGLWETSTDGSYCFFEANFSEPMQAGYAVLALTYDNLTTTYEGKLLASDPGKEDTPIYSYLMSEFAVFDKTLDGKPAQVGAESTPAPETQAPETQAPETQAPETQAPETQAPQTREQGGGDGSPKKGCGGSSFAAAAAMCAAAGAAFFRRKRKF